MKVALANDYQFAHNIISLASKLYSDKRLKSKNQCFCSKIWSITKWPLSNLKCSNAFEIWYLNENKLIWDIWGHIGLKQPRNHKFKIDWAQAFSAEPDLNQNIDFISSRRCFVCTNNDSWIYYRSFAVLHVSVVIIQLKWQQFKKICISVIAPCIIIFVWLSL